MLSLNSLPALFPTPKTLNFNLLLLCFREGFASYLQLLVEAIFVDFMPAPEHVERPVGLNSGSGSLLKLELRV